MSWFRARTYLIVIVCAGDTAVLKRENHERSAFHRKSPMPGSGGIRQRPLTDGVRCITLAG